MVTRAQSRVLPCACFAGKPSSRRSDGSCLTSGPQEDDRTCHQSRHQPARRQRRPRYTRRPRPRRPPARARRRLRPVRRPAAVQRCRPAAPRVPGRRRSRSGCDQDPPSRQIHLLSAPWVDTSCFAFWLTSTWTKLVTKNIYYYTGRHASNANHTTGSPAAARIAAARRAVGGGRRGRIGHLPQLLLQLFLLVLRQCVSAVGGRGGRALRASRRACARAGAQTLAALCYAQQSLHPTPPKRNTLDATLARAGACRSGIASTIAAGFPHEAAWPALRNSGPHCAHG